MNILPRLLTRRSLRKILSEGTKLTGGEVASVTLLNNICIPYSTVNHEHLLRQFRNKTQYSQKYYSIKAAHQSVVDDYRNEHNITCIGEDIPNPYIEIEKSDFPEYIKSFLKNQGFEKPTIIQSQGWPIALSGQNFVGIAQTGTGKTLAYLLPAVVHIKEKKAKKGLGPIVLVLAPTRELARQIENVAKSFEKSMNIRTLCVYGGASRAIQASKLQEGVDILIATPGRLNDFITSKTVSLNRSTYVVLDEADRMLDMGFEPQIRQALEGVPLERQILMFSATWPKEVRHLAKDYLGEFVQVNVGSTELSANHNIKQHVHICDTDKKLSLLQSIMHEISGEGFGKLLIFANTKRFVDTLTLALRRNGWPADGIHGDKTQAQRDKIIYRFKNGRAKILVATDVAARGLDVDGVTHVINYDFPNTSEDYIHRIGRTGRHENKGVSHTILTDEDARQASSLIEVLKEANQEIPQDLDDLARSHDISKMKEKQMKMRPKQNNYQYGQNNHQYGQNNRSNFQYGQRNKFNRFNKFKSVKSSRYGDDYV